MEEEKHNNFLIHACAVDTAKRWLVDRCVDSSWEGTYKNTLNRLQIHELDLTKLGRSVAFGCHTRCIHSPRVRPQGLGKLWINPIISLPLCLLALRWEGEVGAYSPPGALRYAVLQPCPHGRVKFQFLFPKSHQMAPQDQ